MEIVVGLVVFVLVVYVAYKLGKFILKVVVGLAAMALIAILAWQWLGRPQEGAESISWMKDRAEDYYRKLTTSPAGQELAQSMREYSMQAKKIGQEKFAEFRDQQLPAIKEKARRYKEELDRQGKLQEAREFWERFTRWLEDTAPGAPPGR